MPVLHTLFDGAFNGPTNMARDEHLLFSNHLRPAALRLYAWTPPTISLGYFQRLADVAQLPQPLCNLPVVRRPTGGGAILHDREITYCLVVDDSLPVARLAPAALYTSAHQAWRDVLLADGLQTDLAPDSLPFPSPRAGPFFCFEQPGRTDLLRAGAKVLGSAQRRIPGRVLQHGSLILTARFAAHPGAHLDNPPADRVSRWQHAFANLMAQALELTPAPAQWSPEALRDVDQRRAVYADAAWNAKR